MPMRTPCCSANSISAVTSATARAPAPEDGPRRYREDLELLKANLQVVELVDGDGTARVALVPAYQGRVMTSTATGPEGLSLGWINPPAIKAGIAPGPVLLEEGHTGEERDRFIRNTLLKRLGGPESVTGAVLYLVQAEFVTGVVLPVDGGQRWR